MAHPSLVAVSVGANGPPNTAHAVNLNGAQPGELVIITFNLSNIPSLSWPSGWDELRALVLPSSNGRLQARKRVIDGSEGSSIELTSGNNQVSGYIVHRIAGSNGNVYASAGATGTSSQPDSDELTPTGQVGDFLWITSFGRNASGGSITAYPAGYTDGRINTSERTIAAASRALTAAAENPGAFDTTNMTWAAMTLAIEGLPDPPTTFDGNIQIGFGHGTVNFLPLD